jgi:predicted nucleotidyltransferase
MSIEEIRQKISPILLKHQVKRASVFGSYAKKTAHNSSDVDILVELSSGISLLDFVGIKLEIEDALNKRVDLVEYDAIKPSIKKSILESQVLIYG